MFFLFLYIILINLLLFLLMGIDKRKAKLKKWRISEKTLFLFSIIGGSLGGILGIYAFRHKTKHLNFTLGFPIIFIFQIIILLLFFKS